MKSRISLLVIAAFWLAACKPEQPEQPQPEQPQPEITQEDSTRSFALDCGPWRKYLNSSPAIYTLSTLPSGIQALLREEQELIKAVIETDANLNQTSDYIALKEQLEALKTVIPSATTSKADVYSSSKRYYGRSYVSGDTVYINSYPSSYSYSVFREKEKSSCFFGNRAS